MGCFIDQVKLTHALVQNLDEAIKEVKLLGEHEEESSRKITKLEALCKKLRDDTQRLEEEKATLEEMVESHDELLMEIAREMGLDHMGEDEDEEKEENADDGGDAAAPPAAAPPPPAPPAAVPEEINEEGPMEAIPGQEVPMPHEVIMVEAESEIPQLRLYRALMRDYEENLLRLEDDFDDLDDYPNGGRSNVDE
jgi:DnaJ-domain-containing protein 1